MQVLFLKNVFIIGKEVNDKINIEKFNKHDNKRNPF